MKGKGKSVAFSSASRQKSSCHQPFNYLCQCRWPRVFYASVGRTDVNNLFEKNMLYSSVSLYRVFSHLDQQNVDTAKMVASINYLDRFNYSCQDQLCLY